jgi:Fe-S oxidoreductase
MAETLEAEGKHDWAERARKLSGKVVDFSTLVKQLVDAGRLRLQPGEKLPPVTYHDSCHLKRTLHAEKPPRELLRATGHEVKEMFESDMCCGMGGSYSLKFPEISRPILQRKLDNIRKTGCGTVALDCPGCAMQIQGGLDKAGDAVKVRHLAEIVAERLQ